MNESSQEDALAGLIEISAGLSIWLANCPRLTGDGMSRLAFECAERVQCILASRCDADGPLLDQLSLGPSTSVRLRVACNAACSVETLRRLATDADLLVRTAAVERLDVLHSKGTTH